MHGRRVAIWFITDKLYNYSFMEVVRLKLMPQTLVWTTIVRTWFGTLHYICTVILEKTQYRNQVEVISSELATLNKVMFRITIRDSPF